MSKSYFAYIRVSTVKQGERGSSLIEQKSAIEAYALRHGLTITKWFEEMETAAKQGRHFFTRMLTDIRAGKAQGLIVHKIDRSARNLRDWADIAELLDAGVDIRFVNDNFDLLSTGGRLSADIIAAVSASFIRNLREEVKKGMWGRLKQGLYPWRAPVGYLDQGGGKAKIIDPVKGPLVQHLFERYGSNTVSFRALRLEMHAKGLGTNAGKPLSFNGLTTILHNPFYAGVMRLETTGETFPGIHEPLISKALFERVQGILSGKTVPRTRKHRFLFRQMVHCQNCGRRILTGEKTRSYTYYRCHNEECRGVCWSERALEKIALTQLGRIRFDFQGRGDVGTNSGVSGDLRDFGDFAAEIYRKRHGDGERLRTSLNLRLAQADDRLNRLTDLLLDATIDTDTHNARREKLLLDRRGILDELEKADRRSPFQELCEEFGRTNIELLRYESLSNEEKRELLNIVCSDFSVSRESSTFTLRTPYKEIAQLQDPSECDPTGNRTRVDGLKSRRPNR
jgi:site-specific DNA recombinase